MIYKTNSSASDSGFDGAILEGFGAQWPVHRCATRGPMVGHVLCPVVRLLQENGAHFCSGGSGFACHQRSSGSPRLYQVSGGGEGVQGENIPYLVQVPYKHPQILTGSWLSHHYVHQGQHGVHLQRRPRSRWAGGLCLKDVWASSSAGHANGECGHKSL